MKTNIGILSFHNVNNFGAFLQTYCLQETLKKYGAKVSVINYRSRHSLIKEYKNCFGNPLDYFRYLGKSLLLCRTIGRYCKLSRDLRLLNLTRFSFNIARAMKNKEFDLVILGSDEIWNFKNKDAGYDLTYFGMGIVAPEIVSYAASFGQITIGEPIPPEVINQLKRLNRISVRDDNSLRILQSLSISARKALDPTFLFDIGVKDLPKEKSGYILIYSNNISRENEQYIKRYAETTKRDLVCVGIARKWCNLDLIGINAFEWLSRVKNADIVITNSYHGTIYAILHRKKFCVLSPSSKTNKIYGLLNDLGLAGRITDDASKLGAIIDTPIDYDAVFKKIDEYRKESLDYLVNAIY